MLYSIIPFVTRDLNIERSQRYTARKLFTNNSSRLPHNSCPLCTPAGRKQVYKSGGTDQSESSNQTIYSRLTCSTLYLFCVTIGFYSLSFLVAENSTLMIMSVRVIRTALSNTIPIFLFYLLLLKAPSEYKYLYS